MRTVLLSVTNTSPCMLFVSALCGAHRNLHSFPTRRSSDLEEGWTLLPNGKVLTVDAYVFQYDATGTRSEEHTSELQSLTNLVCRLLLEKKNIPTILLSIASTSHTMPTNEASSTRLTHLNMA